MLQIVKYEPKTILLKSLVKYFWVIDSSTSYLKVNNTLLPVGNIDFILNFSSPITYLSPEDNRKITVPGFHFNGITNKPRVLLQEGKLYIIGISFYPMGLFALLQKPLSDFRGCTVNLNLVLREFTQKVGNLLEEVSSTIDKLSVLENELIKFISLNSIPPKKALNTYKGFLASILSSGIDEFCSHSGINRRSLERLFNKHVGVCPKEFQRIVRFQHILNEMLKTQYPDLTYLTYESNYYDQNHFIKEFKSFTGSTPTQFLNEGKAIKQII